MRERRTIQAQAFHQVRCRGALGHRPSTGISLQILLVGDDIGNETQGIEGVKVLGVESDEDTGELLVSAELSHFSQMVVSVGFFDISLEAPDNVLVGNTFTAVAKVELTSRSRVREYEIEGENLVSTKTPTGNWQLAGNFSASPNLSPRSQLHLGGTR